MSKDAMYTGRWYARKIKELSDDPKIDELAQELEDKMTLYLGEKLKELRQDRDGEPVIIPPEDLDKPGSPIVPEPVKPDPRYPHRYPGIIKFDADPDVGGVMAKGNPKHLVIHYTVTRNLESTISIFKKNLVDVHFVVGHKGEVVQMAECNRICAHAGLSKWNGTTGLNSTSIGIEVVNMGPLKKKDGKFFDVTGKEYVGPVRERNIVGYQYWIPFTPEQEKAVFSIVQWAMKTYGIKPENVCGHYECSKSGKIDPAGNMELTMPEYRAMLKTV